MTIVKTASEITAGAQGGSFYLLDRRSETVVPWRAYPSLNDVVVGRCRQSGNKPTAAVTCRSFIGTGDDSFAPRCRRSADRPRMPETRHWSLPHNSNSIVVNVGQSGHAAYSRRNSIAGIQSRQSWLPGSSPFGLSQCHLGGQIKDRERCPCDVCVARRAAP